MGDAVQLEEADECLAELWQILSSAAAAIKLMVGSSIIFKHLLSSPVTLSCSLGANTGALLKASAM